MDKKTENKNFTIKEWHFDDRPREKLIEKGPQQLSNAELIAILIGSGTKNESAVQLAQRILNSCGNNITTLAKLNIDSLEQFKGIGKAKAISIITALELGKRRNLEKALENPNITCSKDAFYILQPIIGDLEHEEFWVLFLNNNNKVIHKQQIGKGGLTATLVDIRMIFKICLTNNATAIILAHNHPSGNTNASEADKQITKKIKEGATTLDIKVLDHLIITEKNYTSFADIGIL